MVVFSIAICDDVHERLLETYLLFEECKKWSLFTWDAFTTSEDLLCELAIEKSHYSMIFLQTNMKNHNSLEIAKKIREKDKLVLLVFIGENIDSIMAYMDTVMFQFIVQPITYSKIKKVIDKGIKFFDQSTLFFCIKHSVNKYYIEQKHVLYIEKFGRKAYIYTRNGMRECYFTTKEILDRLNPSYFMQCHQSYIVNLQYIEMIGKDRIGIVGEKCIPVSRTYKKKIVEKFQEYLTHI